VPFKNEILRNLALIPGWRTKRKIVVIESDDWGSIRMPSKQVYDQFLKLGIPVDKDCYCKYDSLENESDLMSLFEVLSSFKDINGNSPVFTANTIVANPDFDKIRESNFQTYYFEMFTETLKRYPNHAGLLNLYKEGINKKLFYPQFHGREHININLWMDALRRKNKFALLAFDSKSFAIPPSLNSRLEIDYMIALNFTDSGEKEEKKKILDEGLSIFEQLFNYPSRSFIAPSYTWHSDLNPFLAEKGVSYLQGIPFQYQPDISSGSGELKKFHYCGQHNKFSQVYLVRNCHFEPSLNETTDWIDDCLHRINTAFKWNKPAIISTHRLNYIGAIDPSNRDRNLDLLKSIFSAIQKKWHDVEFLTSVQLGDLIRKN
jgi:hypothetical protein